MKRAIPITALQRDIGGVLLTSGWDHHAGKLAHSAKPNDPDVAAMDDLQHLTFATARRGSS